MRRQDKRVGSDHLGRRLTAAALAVVMGAGCVTLAPFQAQAEGSGDAGYEIYPNPHVMSYTGDDYIVKTQVNVVFESGIDEYTVDRLEEVLKLKGITSYTTQEEIVSGKTNILVGIEGSGGFVDTYAGDMTVSTQGLFDKLDSYVLDNQDGVITVLGRDTDAAFYGLTSLYHVFTQMDSYTIQEFHVEDWADVASRGFIEGYYGNPWSTEDRQNLMTWAGYYKLNSYFYAPKDDPKHNAQWRELYTQKELEDKIAPLAQAGNASKCKFVFALHSFMYNGINASNYDDSLEILKKKFEQTMEYGVRQIAVLADDAGVPGGNNEAGWGVYTRLMKDLTDWVSSEEMQEKYQGLKVVIPFCPNDYMGNGNSAQLKYLGQNMPESVPLVVTGGKVWGEVSQNFTSSFTNGVGRGPYMWINWPCTDNSKQHLIMGGYDDFLQVGVNPANIQGIVLNPMQQSEPSKVAIFGNACYSWNIWESEAEADAAWDASFACVDHNTVIPNAASDALRELSKHMINQNMDGRVRVLQESVELKPILNDFKTKLADGNVAAQDVDKVIDEFEVLQQAAQTYRAQAGDDNLKNQIVYWLNCWDDTTEAAIAYLNGVKAVLTNDSNAILQYNTQGKTAFDRSKTHGFSYVGTTQYAEVGVQHIVPFINTLATYVSQYAETAMDPSKIITTFITSRTDTPTGNTSNVFDGNDSTGVTYKNPNSIAKDEYVGVLYNKVIDVNSIRITMQDQADHFEHSKLQYTKDGKQWLDVTLREGTNQFDVPTNQAFEISLNEDALPQDFQAMGVRLITTQANSGACWLDLREFQINQEPSNEAPQIEGTYTISTGLRIRNNAELNVLKDGNNGTEVHLSNTANDQIAADQYILYTFENATQIGVVTFAQGHSAAGDVITSGKVQYQDEAGEWHDAGTVNNTKEQTFDFNGQGIVAKAVRIYNNTEVAKWWRVGEFTVTEGTGNDKIPITYTVMRSDRWGVVGGSNETSLYDGNDSSFVYYDPDGGKEENAPPKDTFDVDEYLGYDLGKVAELASIHLVVGNSVNASDKIVKYAIETSLTGQDGDWTVVPKYGSYTGNTNAVDTLNIELDEPIRARYIRVRNLEQHNKWGYFSEFTVAEVPTGSAENLYTNVQTNILSNKVDGQVSLTSGTVTLNADDYIGVDLGNIKAVTGVTTSELPANVKLQTSMNAVTWTDYTDAAQSIDARYVRVVATADSASLSLTQFQVDYQFIGEKTVESNFDGVGNARDMRTKGNVDAIFDGNLTTYAELAGAQSAGKYVIFDLRQSIHFESLRYYIQETQNDFPRHVKFEVSEDGKTNWQQVLVVGNAEAAALPSTTTAKDMDGKTMTHDSTNPGNMYAEATGLNVDGRYLRVSVVTPYADRWLAFYEIQINGGQYISPESNRDILSETVEEPGHLPSNALDGDYTTTYKPGQADGAFTYRISEPTGLTSVRLVQLGAVSNATVTARYVGENSDVAMGTLSQAINEFILPAGKTLESITVTWTDTIPEIAEITTSTQAVASVDKDALNKALESQQDTSTWTTDSAAIYAAARAEAQAIADNQYASQTMVNAALAALENAVANMVLKATNVAELEKLVADQVSNDTGDYTAVSYNAYASAVNSLDAALENAGNLSQTKAEQLKQAVLDAQAALVYSTSGREQAQLAVEGYAALVEENYTVTSFAAVTEAKNEIDTLVTQDKAAETNADRVSPATFAQAKAEYEQAVAALVSVAALNAALDQFEKVNPELYTKESYDAYLAAVEKGKALLQSGTEDAIAAAVADIQDKYDALILLSSLSLEDVIAQAEKLNAKDYTQDSYAALKAIVDEAKASGEDRYIVEIQKAMAALVNVTALNTQLDAAKAVNADKYTTTSYAVLAKVMEQAQSVLKSGTQEQVAQMVTDLDTAVRSLVARATGVDEYRSSITLKSADDYTAESYAPYKEAYDALMAADPADLSAQAFAQLKGAFEQAELALKAVETEEPDDGDKPQNDVIVDNDTDVDVILGNTTGVFDKGTVITVTEVTDTATQDTVKQALKDVVADMKNTAVLDITATLNNQAVQPEGKLQITFSIPDHLTAANLKLFYVSDDGKVEEIAITVNPDANTVTTYLTHFSTYVLANVVEGENGGNVPQTGDTANLTAYVLMAAVCAAGIAAVMFYMNKKKA